MDLQYVHFKQIDCNDKFFDSLKEDYSEFDEWFNRKANEKAYVFTNADGSIDGFLYLKIEDGPVDDVEPHLPPELRIKIGTFKINAHGTRMGERFIKKALDHALFYKVKEIYVTIFPTHTQLVEMFTRYGFETKASKNTPNGTELVMVKRLGCISGNVGTDYPYIYGGNRKFVLALYPEWHSRLLPDSILFNEDPSKLVKDISHTNSIHKIYLTKMAGTESLKSGDILVIYRTGDGQGPAHYRAVATSVCVVEDVKQITDFDDVNSFLKYSSSYSIFSENELENFFKWKKYPTIIRFTYNIALTKRVIRGQMIEDLGISADLYWGFFQLTDEQFEGIIRIGEVDESLIVN